MGRSRHFRRSQSQQSTEPAPAPPGTEFAYEVAREQLARAIDRVSRVDTKAGILVGVLIAAGGGFLAIPPEHGCPDLDCASPPHFHQPHRSVPAHHQSR